MKRIRHNTNPRQVVRLHKKSRITKRISRTTKDFVRLVVFKSNRFLYAQIINSFKGTTLAQANTHEKDFESFSSKKNREIAKQLGVVIGKRALEKKIEKVVFDRNGYNYHGRVQAVAEGAREAGLRF